MTEQELRLGCLQLAVEVRAASATPEQMIDQAKQFTAFVVGANAEPDARASKARSR
jgi:hypothetical protein